MTNTNIIPIDRAMRSINACADIAAGMRRDLAKGHRISAAQVENRVRDYCDDPAISETDIKGMVRALTMHPAFINRLS